jgi:hypothetical protein
MDRTVVMLALGVPDETMNTSPDHPDVSLIVYTAAGQSKSAIARSHRRKMAGCA